jgi:formate/nitrite transporter FocA (FNT family)
MDCAKPTDVVRTMIDSAGTKLALAPRDLLIRGMLSGALLGAATSLAFTGAISTGQPLVGAKVTLAGWWPWNQMPVTLGNIVGGFVFTHRPTVAAKFVPSAAQVPAE